VAEFTHGQEVALDMMKMAATEAKQAFEGLDRKAQELLGIGSVALSLIGLSSAISKVQTGTLAEVRQIVFGVGVLFFFLLAAFVLMIRLIRKVSIAPMEPTVAAATRWSTLDGDELWNMLIEQYQSVVDSYRDANRKKASRLYCAYIVVTVELALIVSPLLMT